ncbi:MAG: amidohydrolase family protein, partial [Armatimonadetes bacterium]|nr:amidohydrolase family protein [Anaerolineae bacterium]
VAQICRARGIPLASHDDDTAEKVDQMYALGVTISEFPVTAAAAQHARSLGMHTVMGAPNAYRGESTSGNLSAEAAVRAGLVDMLATDYFPAALLQVAFKLAERGVLPLFESAKLVSQYPADALGLHDRGQIAVGRRADLVLVDDDGEHPRVRATLRGGKFIYQDALLTREVAR